MLGAYLTNVPRRVRLFGLLFFVALVAYLLWVYLGAQRVIIPREFLEAKGRGAIVAEEIVHQCAAKGVRRLWIHRAMGSSLSEKTVEMSRESGIEVGCPMMFQAPVDIGHRCMKWWFRLTGALPS